VFDSVFQY